MERPQQGHHQGRPVGGAWLISGAHQHPNQEIDQRRRDQVQDQVDGLEAEGVGGDQGVSGESGHGEGPPDTSATQEEVGLPPVVRQGTQAAGVHGVDGVADVGVVKQPGAPERGQEGEQPQQPDGCHGPTGARHPVDETGAG